MKLERVGKTFGKGMAAELAAEDEVLEGSGKSLARQAQSRGTAGPKAVSGPNRTPRRPRRVARGQARLGSADAPDTNPGMGGKARGCM